MRQRIAVIGSGSWGTAIAYLLATNGHEVTLWCHSEDVAHTINQTHHHPHFLQTVDLSGIAATTSFPDALNDCDAVVFVTPSSYLRDVAKQCSYYIPSKLPVIVLTKGIEAMTGFTMLEVLYDVLGNTGRLACLSGPNHAEEVSQGLPAATVIASNGAECACFFQSLFNAPAFRVYVSSDVKGVELCAATKNVIAIANGMCVAMNLGDNASASLVTRGLAEVRRLVIALGGDPRTCLGLAGMGDLMATCNSVHSRNRSLGAFLVEGGTLAEFEAKTHMVAEGAVACKTVTDLARKNNVEMPISELVRRILWDDLSPKDAVDLLFERPLKSETD